MTGDELKNARVIRGLTQGELASFLGISQGRISQLEAAKRNMTTDERDKALQLFANLKVVDATTSGFVITFRAERVLELRIENMCLKDAIRLCEMALGEMRGRMGQIASWVTPEDDGAPEED